MADHSNIESTRRTLLRAGGAGLGLALFASKTAAETDEELEPLVPEEGVIWEKPRPGVAHNIVREVDVPIPMRDGLELAANVYRPEEDGEYPVIMGFTGWGKDVYWGEADEFSAEGEDWPGEGVGYTPWDPPITNSSTFETEDPYYWVPQGYVVIHVDYRGSGRSPGTLEFGGWGRDTYDAIEWAADQEWSNGNVGLSGVSILSRTQYHAANRNPPSLKAIIPWQGTVGEDGGLQDTGGIPVGRAGIGFGTFDLPHDPAWDAPEDEDPQDPVSKPEDEWFEGVTQPALICGSWSAQVGVDRGDLRAFRKISSEHKWLYNHGREHWGAFYDTEAQAFRKKFFDHFLAGTNDSILEEPSVRVEARDTLREWTVHRADDFPIPGTSYQKLHLDAANGELRTGSAGQPSEVSYDSAELDSAKFDFEFEEDTTLIGYQALNLSISLQEATDADLFITVRKLDSDGDEVKFESYDAPQYFPVAVGFLRLSHRALDQQKSTRWEPYLDYEAEPQEVVPGEIVECRIPIRASGTHFHEGETLRLEVSGSFLGEEDLERVYPAREPGETQYEFETNNEGTHTIHTGGRYKSSLLIPDVTHRL